MENFALMEQCESANMHACASLHVCMWVGSCGMIPTHPSAVSFSVLNCFSMFCACEDISFFDLAMYHRASVSMHTCSHVHVQFPPMHRWITSHWNNASFTCAMIRHVKMCRRVFLSTFSRTIMYVHVSIRRLAHGDMGKFFTCM